MSSYTPLCWSDIQAAHQQIAPYIHRTPVLTCHNLNVLAGCSLFFKCENFQKVGAFKIRGGMNAALSLPSQAIGRGLATHSSGNHAQAVAYAARQLGVKAYIVMPENSPAVKVNAVRSYGAEITFCAPNQAAREATLQEIVARTGAAFIHPYDDDRVICGQATCAKEFLEDVPDLQIVIAPVGGGGLLSGTCLSTHYLAPKTLVYGAEPQGAADAVLSLRSGRIEKAPYIQTIADGLLTTLSERTLRILSQHVQDILTVSDDEILAALRLVYERMKIVVEPSGVVPLAAVLKHPEVFAGKRVGVIFSGGNVDLSRFGGWFS
ncbi:MAG: pyridoxal-phosphate dependent enzyme [Saprospiraceae bacterium]|nr:pyridoxal-phosphate dependent enzyme [Saprospiraceae bacterium]MDW8482740.1 pyridoxal-phosphate dependent enzyme [Saprospiraceae bacterium]